MVIAVEEKIGRVLREKGAHLTKVLYATESDALTKTQVS
jgi:hypothetical protein